MDQVRQRGQGLLDVGVGVRPVDLVQVDVVGLQAAQRVLDLGHDPAARVAALVRVGAHRAVHLGREHDVVAASLQRLADDLLRFAGGVPVGGVDEVDPGVEGLVDDAGRVFVVGIAAGPEHHRAERVGADLDAGPAEGAVLHESLLTSRSRCDKRSRFRYRILDRSGTSFRNYTERHSGKANGGTVADNSADRAPRRLRADAARNIDSLLEAAKAVFASSGVDAPAKEIADLAGVGVGTLYRHFPQRSD